MYPGMISPLVFFTRMRPHPDSSCHQCGECFRVRFQPDLNPHVDIVYKGAFTTATVIGPGATADYNFVIQADGPDGTISRFSPSQPMGMVPPQSIPKSD